MPVLLLNWKWGQLCPRHWPVRSCAQMMSLQHCLSAALTKALLSVAGCISLRTHRVHCILLWCNMITLLWQHICVTQAFLLVAPGHFPPMKHGDLCKEQHKIQSNYIFSTSIAKKSESTKDKVSFIMRFHCTPFPCFTTPLLRARLYYHHGTSYKGTTSLQ